MTHNTENAQRHATFSLFCVRAWNVSCFRLSREEETTTMSSPPPRVPANSSDSWDLSDTIPGFREMSTYSQLRAAAPLFDAAHGRRPPSPRRPPPRKADLSPDTLYANALLADIFEPKRGKVEVATLAELQASAAHDRTAEGQAQLEQMRLTRPAEYAAYRVFQGRRNHRLQQEEKARKEREKQAERAQQWQEQLWEWDRQAIVREEQHLRQQQEKEEAEGLAVLREEAARLLSIVKRQEQVRSRFPPFLRRAYLGLARHEAMEAQEAAEAARHPSSRQPRGGDGRFQPRGSANSNSNVVAKKSSATAPSAAAAAAVAVKRKQPRVNGRFVSFDSVNNADAQQPQQQQQLVKKSGAAPAVAAAAAAPRRRAAAPRVGPQPRDARTGLFVSTRYLPQKKQHPSALQPRVKGRFVMEKKKAAKARKAAKTGATAAFDFVRRKEKVRASTGSIFDD